MSQEILPIQDGAFLLGNQISPQNNLAGSHFSHWGIGGFIELPTLQHMYDIPIADTMNTDGFSSGRRKLGMIVYVIENNKYYQLKPKKNTTLEYVSLSDWQNSVITREDESVDDGQKMVWLDPLATRDYTDFSDIWTGTGNAGDAWTEIEVLDPNKGVISKNSSINNIITLTQDDYTDLAEADQIDQKTLYIISD